MKIVIASHNKGKIKEFKEMLEALSYTVVGVQDFDVDVSEVVEDGDTYADNALIKAKFIYDTLKIPVLSDDSGLNLEAFPDLLGIHSARFLEGKPYSGKNEALVDMYKDINNRKASFETALVYYDGDAHCFTGKVQGEIAKEIKSEAGFGYDPIFIPNSYKVSFAEMGSIEKSKISHRALALGKFLKYLKGEKL